jgi:hypothetical protein
MRQLEMPEILVGVAKPGEDTGADGRRINPMRTRPRWASVEELEGGASIAQRFPRLGQPAQVGAKPKRTGVRRPRNWCNLVQAPLNPVRGLGIAAVVDRQADEQDQRVAHRYGGAPVPLLVVHAEEPALHHGAQVG